MNQNTYIVYKHTNLINNKVYIGITCHGENPNIRWQNGRGYIENSLFFTDILNFGWQNFSHEILADNLNINDAFALEKKYIKEYDSVNNGYNLSYGCSEPPSIETREKISQALQGLTRKSTSIEQQIKTKQNNSGWKNGFDPIETKITKKVKCLETGDIFGSISEAENWSNTNKIGECCSGLRKHAGRHPETNQLLSWAYANNDDIVSIRCLEKRKTKKIKKILCIETNEIFENASDAFRKTNISVCNILRVCNGQRQTAGKKHWKYIDE